MSSASPVKERAFGDILVRFHYIKAEPHMLDSEYEAAMAFTRPAGSRAGSAWFITESAAHLYVNDGKRGGPSEYCIACSGRIAEMLGLTVDKRTCFRICEAILDCIPELLEMPPWTPVQKVIGEIEANFGGTKIRRDLLN